MKTIVGIDYSLSCPCVCVSNGTSFLDKYFYFLHDRKSYAGQALNILGDQHAEYFCDQQRYENIAGWVMAIIQPLDKDNTVVLIEDYAFAAKGRVFNLAENCGLLKYLLYKDRYNFHTVAPKTIKKYATGNGNANKQMMYDAFFELTLIQLAFVYSKTGKVDSPVTDIVDAFYLTQYMHNSLAINNSEKLDLGTNTKPDDKPKPRKNSNRKL